MFGIPDPDDIKRVLEEQARLTNQLVIANKLIAELTKAIAELKQTLENK